MLFIMHRWITDVLPEITTFDENFCRRNAVLSNLCDVKSQNKIAVAFFPNSHDWLMG